MFYNSSKIQNKDAHTLLSDQIQSTCLDVTQTKSSPHAYLLPRVRPISLISFVLISLISFAFYYILQPNYIWQAFGIQSMFTLNIATINQKKSNSTWFILTWKPYYRLRKQGSVLSEIFPCCVQEFYVIRYYILHWLML